ncbi:MAG: transposase, partial [Burkholderiales bacterium]|nr:transposase [Burkholderiales bacterium]
FYACAHQGAPKTAARKAQRRGREPWLLAHSPRLCHYRPDEIVAMYARRMQIEESFRDSKCAQLGMGLELSRSRSAQRLHALLLIATLAAYLLWHIGQLAEAEGLHRRFKATTRRAREISVITLGLLLCALPRIPLSEHAQEALERRLGIRP